MPEPDPNKQHDLPASAMLLLLSGSFLGVGTESLMSGDVTRTVVSYLIGTFFFVVGISWRQLKPMLGPTLSATAAGVASDFRWWLLISGIVFLYVGYPIFSMVRSTPPRPALIAQPPVPAPAAAALSDPVILTPQALRNLTNEDLRVAAYQLSEQISRFTHAQISQETAANDNSSYDDTTRSQQKLRIDAQTNREYRSKYRESVLSLIDEFETRNHDIDNTYLIRHMKEDNSSSGMIDIGSIISIGNELALLARRLP
jgi:hypothetical protein